MKINALLFFLLLAGAQVSAQHTDKIKASAQSWATAITNRDFETLSEYTYPEFLSSRGGKVKWISQMKADVEKIHKQVDKTQNRKEIDRMVKIAEPGIVVQAGEELHCIIPIELTSIVPNSGYLLTTSSLLGISRDNGESWTFAELTYMKSENLKRWFPNFNNELIIPKVTRKFFLNKK